MEKYIEYRDKLLHNISLLRHPNGAYSASLGEHYVKYSWWRDVFFINLCLLDRDNDTYLENYHNYLDAFKGYERDYGKFSNLIKNPIIKEGEDWRLVHPRVFAHDFSENHNECWGWSQTDILGEILIGLYEGYKRGLPIFRDDEDRNIIQLYIDSMIATDFVRREDSSFWEERKQHNASSLGLCVKGLEYAIEMGFKVPSKYLTFARNTLENRLPREAPDRPIDMALLALPMFDVTDYITSQYIVQKVELKLLREHGVIRYEGDIYYSKDGKELEWSMGLLFLGLVYGKLGYKEVARFYLDKCMYLYPDGHIAEGKYYNGENNPNVDLGWSMSLAVLLINKILESEKC